MDYTLTEEEFLELIQHKIERAKHADTQLQHVRNKIWYETETYESESK